MELRVQPFARDRQRRLVDVRRENHEIPPDALGARTPRETAIARRVCLFTGGAAGNPGADLLARRRLIDQRPDDVRLQRVPGLRVAEEGRDRDQEVVEQCLRLRRIRAEESRVVSRCVSRSLSCMRRGRRAAARSCACTLEKSCPVRSRNTRARRRSAFSSSSGIGVARLGGAERGNHACFVARQFGETRRELADRQHEIGRRPPRSPPAASRRAPPRSGSCTSTRPPRSFTAFAPTAPSLPPPDSTTANPSPCCSASDRKNRSMAVRCPRGCANGRRRHRRVGDLQLAVWRNHVDVIRSPAWRRHDRRPGSPASSSSGSGSRQLALVIGSQVHDDDVGEAEIGGQASKEPLERFDAACRCTDPANRNGGR